VSNARASQARYQQAADIGYRLNPRNWTRSPLTPQRLGRTPTKTGGIERAPDREHISVRGCGSNTGHWN